jgi:broad specificity phosphatase PhoE
LKLILVRHGETELNKAGLIQGVNEASLNTTGIAQAAAVARALVGDLPIQLYTSPLRRALDTAAVISTALKVPFTPLKGLEEANAGELEGLTGQEMRQRYPEFARRWAEDSALAQMPGGESLLQVQQRAWPVIAELAQKHPDEAVVVVTHNFTIQAIVCRVLDMPLRNSRRLRQDLGGITRLELTSDRSILLSLNETWHLRA